MARNVLTVLLAVAVVVTNAEIFDEKLSYDKDTTQAKLDREAYPEESTDVSATYEDLVKNSVVNAESDGR